MWEKKAQQINRSDFKNLGIVFCVSLQFYY